MKKSLFALALCLIMLMASCSQPVGGGSASSGQTSAVGSAESILPPAGASSAEDDEVSVIVPPAGASSVIPPDIGAASSTGNNDEGDLSSVEPSVSVPGDSSVEGDAGNDPAPDEPGDQTQSPVYQASAPNGIPAV